MTERTLPIPLPNPMELMDSADRLRWVADLLEKHPNNHKQNTYIDGFSQGPVEFIEGLAGAVDCGSRGCACGWGIAIAAPGTFDSLMSRDDVESLDWDHFGAAAFGIEYSLAEDLFGGGNEAAPMVYLMRWLARLPESERTRANAERFKINYSFLVSHTVGESFREYNPLTDGYDEVTPDLEGAEAFARQCEARMAGGAEARRLGVQL